MKGYHFEIGMINSKIDFVIEKTIEVEIKKFPFPTSENGVEKMLILKSSGKVCFIKTVNSPINEKLVEELFSEHLIPTSESKLFLDIFLLPELSPDQSTCLAAELLFEIRRMSGEFPSFQSQIRIISSINEEVKSICSRIVEELFEEIPFELSFFFKKPPRYFGLRGDDLLWVDLADILRNHPLPKSYYEFNNLLLEKIKLLTEKDIRVEGDFFVEKYNGRGSSGGYISSETWLNVIIPELVERFLYRVPIWKLK